MQCFFLLLRHGAFYRVKGDVQARIRSASWSGAVLHFRARSGLTSYALRWGFRPDGMTFWHGPDDMLPNGVAG
jgi:hypothetical protein